MTYLGIHQCFGYDPNDLAASVHDRVCNDTHEPDTTTPIDQRDLLIGEGSA